MIGAKNDSIFLSSIPTYPPREPAESDPNYIKHVHCSGARFHTYAYIGEGKGFKCSEPLCIMNKPDTNEGIVMGSSKMSVLMWRKFR